LAGLDGGLSQLRSVAEDAVFWLASCGSWHAYEKMHPASWSFRSGLLDRSTAINFVIAVAW